MSDPTSVFENEQAAPTGQQEQAPLAQPEHPSTDAYSDQLKGIVAEDGRQKYGTVDKALEALAHSQTLIPTLKSKTEEQEAEITKLREELAKRDGVQDVVEQLSQHQQQVQAGNPSEAPIGVEDVARILEETLAQRTAQQKVQDNAQKVNNALTTVYGDQAASMVQAKAKELNTTPSELGKLAEQNPDLVLSLFGQKSTSPTPTKGSLNLGFAQPPEKELGRPDKSLLSGATSKDQMEYMRKVKEEVYKKFGVEPQ